MNFRSPAVLFVTILAASVVVTAIVMMLIPVFFKAGLVLLGIIPLLITIAGLVSCISSDKETSTILLWIVIMILAPLLGPLLWFAWGKRNT